MKLLKQILFIVMCWLLLVVGTSANAALPDHSLRGVDPVCSSSNSYRLQQYPYYVTSGPYGLRDYDCFPVQKYGANRIGILLGSERDVIITGSSFAETIHPLFHFNWLTNGPYNNIYDTATGGSAHELFLSNSNTSLDLIDFPPATWVAPVDPDPNSNVGGQNGSVSFASTNTVHLFRKLHFENILTDAVSKENIKPNDAATINLKKTIILIHGWNPDSNHDSYKNAEFENLIAQLDQALRNSEWRLLEYRWESDADTGDNNLSIDAGARGTRSAEIAHQHGQHLGELVDEMFPNLEKAHFIAHSAGSWAARAAVKALLSQRSSSAGSFPQPRPQVKVQVTLLDAFVPGGLAIFGFANSIIGSSLSVSEMNNIIHFRGVTSETLFRLDNYYAKDRIALSTAWGTENIFSNWRAGRDVPGLQVDYQNNGHDYYSGHTGPIEFYADSVFDTLFVDGTTLFFRQQFGVRQTGWALSMFFNEPQILRPPKNQEVPPNGTATFTVQGNIRGEVSSTPDNAGLKFYWQRCYGSIAAPSCYDMGDTNALGGQLPTGPTISVGPVTAADNGNMYRVIAKNSAGEVISNIVTLTVQSAATAPTITTPPQSQTAPPGTPTIQFDVVATGTNPTYQWRKDGAPISGETSSSLILYNITAADAGSYTVVATNSLGSATSTPATLTVSAAAVAPAITLVTPAALPGLTLPQRQLITLDGTGFTANSRLTFSVGITTYANRVPVFTNNQLQYSIAVGNPAQTQNWTVKVVNGAQASTAAPFTVTHSADTTLPQIKITGVERTAPGIVHLSGTATDDVGVTGITWSTDKGASGTASFSFGRWNIPSMTLAQGANVITVSAADAAGHVGTDTVTLSPAAPGANISTMQIAAGDNYSIALKSDGTVWAWGRNINGQLGDGTTMQRNTPVQVSGLSGVVAISAGGYHAVAVKSDGTVWTWGTNILMNGPTTQSNTPVQVSGLSGVVSVAAAGGAMGFSYTMALKSDGTVWGWGDNWSGQLGDGTSTIPRLTPVQVIVAPGIPMGGVIAIAAGSAGHSIALKSDGTVWAWGNNAFGQLGDGTSNTTRLPPAQVMVATGIPMGGVAAIVAGSTHSMALKSDGTVWAWGGNWLGQLGDGTTIQRNMPVQVPGLSGVASVAAGSSSYHSLAVKSDGTVVAWGANNNGQLGDGTVADRLSPVLIGLSGVVSVAGGLGNSLTLKSDGTVWTWGYNDSGQLGDGTTIQRLAPVQTLGTGGTGFLNLATSAPFFGTPATKLAVVKPMVAVGWCHTLALKSDGTVIVVQEFCDYGMSTVPVGLSNVVAVSAGYDLSLALKSNGTVVAWGNNFSGQSTVPAGLSNVVAVAAGDNHSLALKSDGTVVAWGSNGCGQSTVPAGLSNVVAVAGGECRSLALKSDGTVVVWGQIQDGLSMVQATVPAGLSNVVAVAAGSGHTLALKSDGTVVAWTGKSFTSNWYGESTVPAGLSNVVAVAAGDGHSMALKSDGTVVAWGAIGFTRAQNTLPVGLSNVVSVAARGAHSLSLKSDGTMVASAQSGYQNTVPASLNLGVSTQTTVALNSSSMTFAAQDVGTSSAAKTFILTNSGTGPMSLNSIAAGGDFAVTHNCPASLAAVASCAINVTFTPLLAGARDGLLTLWSDTPDSPQMVSLTGTGNGTAVAALSTSLATFSNQAVGSTSAAQAVTFTNGGTVALGIGSIAANGDFLATHNCPASLAPGANCSINVQFSPTAPGNRTGILSVTSPNGTTWGGALLNGTGMSPVLVLSSSALNFAPQTLNTASATQPIALTNTGNAALNITSIAASGDYAVTHNCGTSLAAGANCAMSITFTPTVLGARSGTLSITTNAAGSPYSVSLSGNGVAPIATVPGAPTIGTATAGNTQATVTFTAPASNGGSAITGYTATSNPGGFTSSSGCTGSPCTVTGLTNGTAYTFTVKATNSIGTSAASAASNPVTPKASQTIGAITFLPATLTIGTTTTASATGGASGLPVTFTSTPPGVCTATGINGKTITGIAAGICTIAANQAGNASYNAAPQATQTIVVAKRGQTIGPITFTPSTLAVGRASTASATATSGLAVTFTTTSPACSVNGSTITGIAAGACLITANQAGNANYNAAPLRAQTLTVGAAPAPVVSLNRTALIFAARNLAKPSPAQVVTLTNTGASALNLTGIVASGDFARTTTCAATLAAGASCTLSVTFTATAMGARTGAITLTSNAAGSPHRITLTGTGKGTRHDFNGDGKTDLLWRNPTSGANQIWFMNGGIKTSSANITPLAPPWVIAGVDDFNGDGKADILWRHPTNKQTVIWLMNGITRLSSTIISPAVVAPWATAWNIAGTGDFNGDGKADILWRSNLATGLNQIWLMNGAARTSAANTTAAATALAVAGVADFNGDGKTDILWRNAATGQDAVWLMNGAVVMAGSGATGTLAAPWSIAGTGDFNADGKADILWRNPTNGLDSIWYMNGVAASGVTTGSLAISWSVAGVSDFNGDGKADITWRGPLGATTLWLMNGAALGSSAALAPAMPAPWSVAK